MPIIFWLLEFHISLEMTLTSSNINTPSVLGSFFLQPNTVA